MEMQKQPGMSGEQPEMPEHKSTLIRILGICVIIGGVLSLVLGLVGVHVYGMEKTGSHFYWTAPMYMVLGGLAIAFSQPHLKYKMGAGVMGIGGACIGFFIAVLVNVIIQYIDTTGDQGREHYDAQIAINTVLLLVGLSNFACAIMLVAISTKFYFAVRKYNKDTGGSNRCA